MLADVVLSVCRPSSVCISKTKQNRPLVTMEHYIKVGTADSVAAFGCSAGRPRKDILVSNKNMFNY